MSEITELMFGVFQIDAEIFRLQNEKVQMLQELVESEIKAYGHISQDTQTILDVQHSEVVNGKVREIKEWEKQGETNSMRERRVISNEELDGILAKYNGEGEPGAVKLSNCIISNYVFKGDLSNINFDNSELRYCEFRHTKANKLWMKNTMLSNVKLVQAEFNDCDFRHADFVSVESRSSIFRNCSLEDAVFRQSLMDSSYFYKTSFFDAHIRQTNFSGENVFYKCTDIDTVKIETPTMRNDEAEQYKEKVTNALNNEGYKYSWELGNVDIEAMEAELSIKISHEGKVIEDQKYTALLDNDTYEIVHVDTGRLEDPIVKMLLPRMNAAIRDALEKNVEKTVDNVELKLPYMTRDTFMKVKEEIKRMGAKYDPDNKKWYVESGADRDTVNRINDYLLQHDEAIYLKLPPSSPQKFRQITEQIKNNGARYNPDKKTWYITEKENRNQFLNFLPSDKGSVHEKLSQYKESVKEQTADNHSLDSKRKETPELV